MSECTKVSNEVSSSSVDSLNTNSCSSKNSGSTNETVNTIKYQESASGFSTPPTASADTCDSGFTEFFSKTAGTSQRAQKRSDLAQKINPRDCRESTSDSSDSEKWKTEEVLQCLDDDSYDGTDSEETDFRSKEKVEMNRISFRWVEWCHRQLVTGVNPRTILRKIFRNGEFPVPPGISDRELWGRIASFVTQPPARNRLHDINSIDHVIGLLTTCKNIIVLTGAGVSVSCGIPDFRSRSGIYQRLRSEIPEIEDPHEIFDIRFFSKDPRPFFKFAKELFPGSFTPSLCHRFIRLLEKKEKLLRNYSQNIDTLERQAGIERVVECHGSFATASCTKCNVVVSADEIRDDVLAKRIPMCAICNPVSENESTPNQTKRLTYSSSMTEGYKDLFEMGILKPDIVFFGESLPEVFHPAINADRQQCDCLLVIGSSLKVRPVSLIPEFLKADVPQILINRERVGNYVFDIELLGDADIIVNQLCRMIGDDWTEICEQPELKLSSTLEFNPETNETVNLPLARRKSQNVKLSDSTLQRNLESPTRRKSIEKPSDTSASTTESTSDKKLEVPCASSLVPAPAVSSNDCHDKIHEPSTFKEEPTSSSCKEKSDDDDTVADDGGKANSMEKVFLFTVDNVPTACYYHTHPNKYVFPGSTHTWYGSGNPDKDEIFEVEEDEEVEIDYEDDDEDDDNEEEDDDDCVEDFLGDEDKCETESSTNHGESDSNDTDVRQSDSALLGKRVGKVGIGESVSPSKQQKVDDEELRQ